MSEHTRGPWIDARGTTTGRVVVAPDQPKIRYSVAACGGPNREANARLIAAAPDLLAVAKANLSTLEAQRASHISWGKPYAEINTAIDETSAAIALATAPARNTSQIGEV